MPRVEVDRSLPPVAVPKRIVLEMLGHARETLPEECCGLIVGSADERYRRLEKCSNDMTHRHATHPALYPRDGTTAFWMNERDYLRTLEAAEAAGESVTAVYHSHVGQGVYLSDMDQDYARGPLFPFPDAEQIVVAVPNSDSTSGSSPPDEDDGCAPYMGIFVWDAGAATFRGRRVRPSAP